MLQDKTVLREHLAFTRQGLYMTVAVHFGYALSTVQIAAFAIKVRSPTSS